MIDEKGLYDGAAYVRAHGGRIGAGIYPRAVVVHTTDMLPNSFVGLVQAWSRTPGRGQCAHFIIGRNAVQGVVQTVPVNLNANHAGGNPTHGWWMRPNGVRVHPNLFSVGIEVHNAGALSWKDHGRPGTTAVLAEGRKVVGEFKVDAGEVYIDHLGRPWHAVTQYQKDRLAELLRTLGPALRDLDGAVVEPDEPYNRHGGKWDTSYAVPVSNALVGHVSLDPLNKLDPGPELMAFINDFAIKEGWTA